MAFQQVPNTVEIAVHYTLGGQPLVNTYHAERPAGYNVTQIEALGAFLDANGVQDLLALQSVHLAYAKTTVRGLHSEYDFLYEDDSNAGSGGVAQQSLPGDRAFCIQRLSGQTGRSARGRVYVAGIPISYLEAGTAAVGLMAAGYADSLVAAVETIRSDIAAGGIWNPVIVSRNHDGTKRAVGITFPWSSTQYSDRVLDVRRSRRR